MPWVRETWKRRLSLAKAIQRMLGFGHGVGAAVEPIVKQLTRRVDKGLSAHDFEHLEPGVAPKCLSVAPGIRPYPSQLRVKVKINVAHNEQGPLAEANPAESEAARLAKRWLPCVRRPPLPRQELPGCHRSRGQSRRWPRAPRQRQVGAFNNGKWTLMMLASKRSPRWQSSAKASETLANSPTKLVLAYKAHVS